MFSVSQERRLEAEDRSQNVRFYMGINQELIYSVVSLLLQADFYCIFNVGVGSFSVSVTNVFGKS